MSEKKSKNKAKRFSDLFDIEERKEILRKYLYFLAWIEVLIFVACWIYQLGSETSDGMAPVDIPFPWKAYFALSFLAPLAITFIVGTIIVGFNKYFGDGEQFVHDFDQGEDKKAGDDKLRKLYRLVRWFQHVPFLGLLLLLGAGVGIFYKLDSILAVIGHFGQQSLKTLLILLITVLGIVSFFVMLLIFLNYRLRKKSMEYQFRSEMADKFGLIILEDNTVINSDGKLLVQGKKWKKALPHLKGAKKGKDSKALPSYSINPTHATTNSTD